MVPGKPIGFSGITTLPSDRWVDTVALGMGVASLLGYVCMEGWNGIAIHSDEVHKALLMKEEESECMCMRRMHGFIKSF